MNKNSTFLCMLLFISYGSFSQNAGLGTANPDNSAALDITHTSKGLLIPRMNTTTILSINSPARGLFVYDSLINRLMVNVGTPLVPNWQPVSIPGWSLAGNNGINPANQFIGTTDNQPLRFRANNTGVGELNAGSRNIFWGLRAGQNNVNGSNNIAIGSDALKSNTDAGKLVAIGDSALFNNAITGTSNTAIGSKSLFSNTTGSENTAIGFEALNSNTTGDSNTAVGLQALILNTSGHRNTAIGSLALIANTSGFQNTAVGASALKGNTTGSLNTAVGEEALFSNTTGFVNTAMGFKALFSNTTGSFNNAFGEFSLVNNTTGLQNTGIGNFSLQLNTTGNSNTATGTRTLFANLNGSENTVNGVFSMQNNVSGSNNTAIGFQGLLSNQTGSRNTALGSFAGDVPLGDSDMTFIGFGANNRTGLTLANSIALGSNSVVTASNQVRIGNLSITSIGGAVGFTTFSDGRYKRNIQEKVKGIDFIMKLRPVTYQLEIGALNNKLNPNANTAAYSGNDMEENAKTIFSGFIAQEVEQAAKEAGYDFSGIDKPKNGNDLYGLRYADFVVPLVKAIQEQQQIINEMRKINADQKRLNEDLLKRLEKLESSANAKQ